MAEREKSVSQTALAAMYNVDARTIRNWVEAGMPQRKQSGRPVYLLSEVIPWRRDQDRKESVGMGKGDTWRHELRKTMADADLAELKVSQKRGDLIPAIDVERDMERLCAVLRARVLGIRGRWAPKIIGLSTMAEATAVLDALANDILDALRQGADELDEPEAEDAA